MPTHAQIARNLTAQLPSGVFAEAVRDAVVHGQYLTLERMLPGVKFAHRKVNSDEWELIGTCDDGTTLIWRVGD